MNKPIQPRLLILNQMAGPMTWELAEDLGRSLGMVALLTGHPDTLQKHHDHVQLFRATAYQRGGYAKRVLTWVLYCWQAFIWLWRWPRSVPVLLFSNPPILCWLGYVMLKLRGQCYAVMVHDIYPDVLVGLGKLLKDHWIIRLWQALNQHAYEHARVVMTLGEHMAANLDKQFDACKTPAGRVEVIYPWVDTEVIKPIPKEQNWFAQKCDQVDKLTVMYSGNMGMGHDIETMLAAAQCLQDTPDIHFMFIGAGPKWTMVADMIRDHNLPNVTLLPWQPEETVRYSMATADIALVSIEEGFEGLMMPSKAFAFLAAGVALLAISTNTSELTDMINRYDCGWSIRPGQSAELSRILRTIWPARSDIGRLQAHSRQAAEQIGTRANSVSIADRLQFLN